MRAASFFVLNGDVSVTLSKLAAACLLAAAVALGSGCGSSDDEDKTEPSASASAKAGGWKTWVLGSGAEVKVPPPPKAGSAAAERDERELKAAVGGRTEKQVAAARSYTSAPAVEPWIEQNIQLVASLPKDVPASSRAYSNTTVAMYDAVVAASHWQDVYKRKPPPGSPTVPRSEKSSYPSGHAAMAGAASRVLAYLYPKYPQARLDERAEDAARSLVAAGAIYPSDAAAGLKLGRQVGDRVAAQAKRDGFDTIEWDGKRPRGPEHWEPPPGSTGQPNRPFAAKAKPWVVKPISRFRPKPPPKYGSKEFEANARDVMKVKEDLTPEQKRIAQFWEGMEGTALPAGIWNRVAIQYVREKKQSVPEQARTFALLNVALADAGSAIWDSKYLTGWWDPRPINAIRDLGLDKKWNSYLLPTPLFPAYPSGTSGYSGAAGTVLAYLFPEDAEMWRARATEAGMSRLYGGVHWRIDVTAGLGVGRKAGGVVVEHAKRDGADKR